MYDYLNHFKTYGFNWEDNKIGLRYFVKKVGTKVQKRLTLSQNSRKMIVLDEQRIFNVHYSVKRDLSDIKIFFLTIAMAYLWTPYNQTNDVFNFESLTKRQKIDFSINFFF